MILFGVLLACRGHRLLERGSRYYQLQAETRMPLLSQRNNKNISC